MSWVRGADAQECVSTRELAALVEAQMGRVLFVAPTQATMWVEASIERTREPAGYAVRFGLIERGADTVSATRALALPAVPCRELDSLLAFVLAAMLDPDAPLLPPRMSPALSDATRGMLRDLFEQEPTVPPIELAAPAAESRPPEPGATVTTAATVTTEPRAARRIDTDVASEADDAAYPRLTLALFANAGVGAGLLPGLGASGALEVRWRFIDAWTLRAGGAFWPEASVTVTATSTAGFTGFLGAVAVCPGPLWERAVPLRLCAGALLGGIVTRASGVSFARDPSRLYAAPSLALDASWSPGGGVWLRLGVTGFAPLGRDRFLVVDASGEHVAHRPSAVGGQLDTGVGFAFF